MKFEYGRAAGYSSSGALRKNQFLEKWTKNLLAMDSCVAAGCWTIPSVWYCFCLGLLSPALAWHPAMKWKKHFVLSSAVSQGKQRPSSWHVCTPKTCTCLMGVVDITWSAHLLCPRTGFGDLEQKLSLPSAGVLLWSHWHPRVGGQ